MNPATLIAGQSGQHCGGLLRRTGPLAWRGLERSKRIGERGGGNHPSHRDPPPIEQLAFELFGKRTLRLRQQRGDDLGERMTYVFAELWRRGHRNVVLIGSDLPPVPLETLYGAFAQLSGDPSRVVLGPSRDGGYYLVGMNQPAPHIFSGMTWSHERVLAETTEKLIDLGIDFRLLPEWFDIDTVGDIARLQAISDPVVRAAM
ncbi:MAG TPA: TIGR04282 family arsenosugar biosynthesis glycosyltransferase, partial [Methyloceanibacter sp.]|nr:TIGR04282 family arsenosugar biosynthesis glycosyltransferase [Methyloceanibacter sp.]